jgi:hypothetical protein
MGLMEAHVAKVSERLHQAAETHHRPYRIVDGIDDDWATYNGGPVGPPIDHDPVVVVRADRGRVAGLRLQAPDEARAAIGQGVDRRSVKASRSVCQIC